MHKHIIFCISMNLLLFLNMILKIISSPSLSLSCYFCIPHAGSGNERKKTDPFKLTLFSHLYHTYLCSVLLSTIKLEFLMLILSSKGDKMLFHSLVIHKRLPNCLVFYYPSNKLCLRTDRVHLFGREKEKKDVVPYLFLFNPFLFIRFSSPVYNAIQLRFFFKKKNLSVSASLDLKRKSHVRSSSGEAFCKSNSQN